LNGHSRRPGSAGRNPAPTSPGAGRWQSRECSARFRPPEPYVCSSERGVFPRTGSCGHLEGTLHRITSPPARVPKASSTTGWIESLSGTNRPVAQDEVDDSPSMIAAEPGENGGPSGFRIEGRHRREGGGERIRRRPVGESPTLLSLARSGSEHVVPDIPSRFSHEQRVRCAVEDIPKAGGPRADVDDGAVMGTSTRIVFPTDCHSPY
jgi:hypothetical protein